MVVRIIRSPNCFETVCATRTWMPVLFGLFMISWPIGRGNASCSDEGMIWPDFSLQNASLHLVDIGLSDFTDSTCWNDTRMQRLGVQCWPYFQKGRQATNSRKTY